MNQHEMFNLYLTESLEHLERIEPDLLKLEESPDVVDFDVINSMFRGVHSIKGGAGVLSLKNIGDLSHHLESLLDGVREGIRKPDPQLVDVLLAGVDELKQLLDVGEDSDKLCITPLLQRLTALQNLVTPTDTTKVKLSHIADDPYFCLAPETCQRLEQQGRYLYRLDVPLDIFQKKSNFSLSQLLEELVPFGEIIDSSPQLENPATILEEHSELRLLYSAIVDPEMLEMALDNLDSSVIHPLAFDQQATMTVPPDFNEILLEDLTPSKKNNARMEESLRVRLTLLDDLMNLASELVLSRNQMFRFIDEITIKNTKFRNIVQTIDRVTTELQEKIMQTRLQPVSVVFNRLPRMVRDLSRKMGKEISLSIQGGEVELDRSIIENLADPMTHLIRNSIDHGIDNPEERMKKGKPPEGRIEVRAYHEGGRVQIDIIDDGRGINLDRIKEKAIASGLHTLQELTEMTDEEIMILIFHAGLSTAEELSEISGRGVGMDVVRTNIEELGGTINLSSTLGKRTCVNLRLPLTLAIIPSLIISVKGRKFAIPQEVLCELVRIKVGDNERHIEMVHGAPVLRLRDRLLPIVCLREILGLEKIYQKKDGLTEIDQRKNLVDVRSKKDTDHPEKNVERRNPPSEGMRIMVLDVNDNQFGLVVEEICNSEEVVVKSLPRFFKNIACYSGTTILGDGSVAIILDVAGIMEMASLRFAKQDNKLQYGHLDSEYLENRELQNLIIFENSPTERLAFNLDLIQRVEKIRYSDLESIGDQLFLKQNGKTLKILKMEKFLPLKTFPETEEHVYIIIPKNMGLSFGILTYRIVDSLRRDVEMDTENICGDCILGSAIIDNNIILFPDIYAIREKQDPTVHNSHGNKKALGKNITCLLAEDTPFFRTIISSYLRDAGFIVDLANDGIEAKEKLSQNSDRYQLIISDIQMPRMDGLEFCRWIRSDQRFAKLPVMALTSLFSEKDQQKGYEAGFNRYEQKLNRDLLLTGINQLLEEFREGKV